MDEETKARLARREERRRRREEERAAAERLPRRSTSLPTPSPALAGNHEKPKYFARTERASAVPTTEDRPLDEEAADKIESLSAKKAAYLRAVEKREQRASRRHNTADAAPDGSANSPPDQHVSAKKSDDGGLHSPDRSARSGKSSKHRSSRESTTERKERKSSRRASIASTVDEGRAEKRRSGDADLSKVAVVEIKLGNMRSVVRMKVAAPKRRNGRRGAKMMRVKVIAVTKNTHQEAETTRAVEVRRRRGVETIVNIALRGEVVVRVNCWIGPRKITNLAPRVLNVSLRVRSNVKSSIDAEMNVSPKKKAR